MSNSYTLLRSFLPILLLLFAAGTTALAQPEIEPIDTLGTTADTVRASVGSPSGIDTVVTYDARDSIIFEADARKIYLYGDATVVTGSRKLTGAYIEIDFATSELFASSRFDSLTRQEVGVPVFKDSEQEFSARTIRYNFKTGVGTSEAVETAFDNGFYFGQRIKRVSKDVLFIKDGVYTTCDAPKPHYFFASDEMKVVVGDRIFAEQPTLHVANVPILPIPIGVFFAPTSGKQSGLIIPRWSQNTQRGFTIEGLGYFWAGNEYVDSKILANLYSKGGWTLNNYTRFRLRGVIERADLDLTYGQTRQVPDDPLESSLIVGYGHSQQIGRRQSLTGTLNFSTRNAIRNTTTRTSETNRFQDITTQRILSNFGYSNTFDWGSLTASYDRNQNIITNELEETAPSVRLSFNTITPFATPTGEGILQSLALGGQVSGIRRFTRADTLPGGGFRVSRTQSGITYNPSINLSPKFDAFTIQPFFNYSGGLFPRSVFYQPNGDTVITPGLTHTYTYSYGATVRTQLYGIIQPRIFGINAIRHEIVPMIGYRGQPDLSDPRYGLYQQRFDRATNEVRTYSIVELDAGASSAPGPVQSMTFDLGNSFDAKIFQGDTLEDKRVRFLSVNISTFYNWAVDSLRLAPINIGASTRLGEFADLSASMVLDPYAIDSDGRKINELVFDRGEGLGRITDYRAELRFSANFSDQGFGTGFTATPVVSDSATSRRQRFDFEADPFDIDEFFGEHVRATDAYQIPWQIGFSGNYNISRLTDSTTQTNFSINTQFSFAITPSTQIRSSASYDMLSGSFQVPTIGVVRDLHCWEMVFDWVPTGFSRGFYFRLGLKAPELQDIKLEREASYYVPQ